MSKSPNAETGPAAAETASDAAAEALTWSRPTIKTLDVATSTEGGTFNANSPGDGSWYQS